MGSGRAELLRCEPGVTIKQLWEYTIEDGWWPPVVPGTMFPTLGGVLAMNIHGKNNFKAGTIGEHVLAFDFLAASGEELHVDRETDSELFNSIIGSFGMLGCFTSITLQAEKSLFRRFRCESASSLIIYMSYSKFTSIKSRIGLSCWLD